MAENKKKKTASKRGLTDVEKRKIRSYQQSYMGFVYNLTEKDNINAETKKILRSMLTDLKSALAKSSRLSYL
ncbi:hypothetical protein LJC53_02910 [Bacteroidales bacterium OttesenSCG-928-C03]|nr:hypothetical protein [Bacteroidales bacterium OttesenSCG-928-C03]MDL2326142.1 hypothetical protein [Bacteroidales bacterium OttesenSCG-928-A14]